MPIITNFGDVVTVGNAAVNGTGTSSFAGPVTFAQGVTITGGVSTTSAFYGVLAGANTAAVSALTASTNVYAPIVTTPISNAATAIATTGFYGALVGQNVASVTVLTASGNVNAPVANMASLNVSTQANVTFLNVSSGASLFQANVLTANITSSNVLTENVATLNVSGLATLSRMNVVTANITSANVLTENVATLNVSGFATLFQANVLTANITSANVITGNVTTLNVSGLATLFQANVLTANITSANVLTGNVSTLNVSGFTTLFQANVLTANLATANITTLNVSGESNVANLTVRSNLYTSNIIMSSNLSTNTGFGNVYLTGNLVVAGNIYSVGGSVGSGSGTSQGVLYSLGANYSLGAAFATGTAGPGISGYHINLSTSYFTPEAVASVSAFSAASGMLKFATGGLYQVTCVIVGDQPVAKVAIGKQASGTFPTGGVATTGYDYVYNYPVGSSPSEMITIPLTVTDVNQYYYLDVFFSTAGGAPSVLYPTRSTTAVGSAYGTYVQVSPFGNYLTSATGVASGLLMNCYGTTTLSSPVTANTFRLAMTSSNGWTVNGVSTSLAVTSGGNFQVSQVGIYEVSLCLNPSATPMMFGVGSLTTDGAPTAQGPYLYQYAPMYTQDPTTVVTMPLNITDTSKYYYLDVIFPGTQATVTLSNVSTFVSLKPVGSYVSPSTNPWAQQGTSVTYTGGAVGIGGVNPSLLTETFTVNGNTSFVGNVTVTSDASSNTYVVAKRVPAGSAQVNNYVVGAVPLTTTTNLIQNYLSNAATIGTQNSNVSVSLPGTGNSGVAWLSGGHSANFSNLALSNIFIETWVYRTGGQAGSGQIIFGRPVPNTSWDFAFQVNAGTSTATVTFYLTNTSGTLIGSSTSSGTIGLNTWTHIAASYNRTSVTTGQPYVFINGTATTGTAVATQPRLTPTAEIHIGVDYLNNSPWNFQGFIQDVRVMTGSIVPVANFTPQAGPFTTAPTYRTGMDTGYTSNLTMALQSQYFPGASTSPYGPCLTLPGTVGSYYSSTPAASLCTAFNGTGGFTLEAWVNFASFANSNLNASSTAYPYMITNGNANAVGANWAFGATVGGNVAFNWWGGTNYGVISANTMTTGQWTHLVVVASTTTVSIAINGVFSALSGQGYTPTTGNNGTAPTIAPSTVQAPYTGYGISLGQWNNTQGPNYAIAKARLVYGAALYSVATFTPSPNFITSATAPVWQLDSQYPLPTFPSIQDVTELPQQASSYGSLPTPVGGVTSNTLGPYTAYPSFDSIRFDGTGYIDYGNAASSVMTTNLWANAWTIEGWVYPTVATGNVFSRSNTSTGYDWSLGINSTSNVFFDSKATAGEVRGAAYLAGSSGDTGNSVAVDASGNVYITGSYTSTTSVTLRNLNGTASAYSLPISSTGTDAFIVKYNAAGSVVAYSYISDNGGTNDAGNSIIVDVNGNVYVTGYYLSTAGTVTLRNLDTTASASSYSLPISVGVNADAFIVKYNSSGSVVGYSYINGSGGDSGQSLAVDSSGNLYVTGIYRSTGNATIRNIDATASTTSYILPGGSASDDAFIIKYNSSGSVVAYSYINGTSGDSGQSLTVDSSGNLYVTGYYASTGTVTIRNLDTTASTSVYSLPIASGGDGFVIKYNSSGSVVAYSYINGDGSDQGNSITVDSSGNVYVTGSYTSTGTVTLRNLDTTASTSAYSLPISSGSTDMFLVKYNSSGSVVGYSYINGTGGDSGQSLAIDSSGNLYVTGYYRSTGTVTLRNIDTTASTSAYSLPISLTNPDTFIIKYNSSGSVVAYSYMQGGGSDQGNSLVVDSGGNLYVTGYYNSPGGAVTVRNLDTTGSASSYTLPIASTQDAFLIKYNTTGLVTTGPSAPVNTWTHVAASYDGSTVWLGAGGRAVPLTPASAPTFITDYSTQIGGTFSRGQISGNLADLRVSNVARYTGSSYTVPSAPFATDSNTLLLLKSLSGQPATTLEIQGRGLNAVSLGATRSVQSYPPAPMSSYLLDTTSNSSVSYGQGKYVSSSSSELASSFSWQAFNKLPQTPATPTEWTSNNGYTAGVYTGSVTTVDTLGTAYAGEWLQLQNPVSYILSSYSIQPSADSANSQSPVRWWILGSRDGLNWTLVDSRSGITVWTNSGTQSFTASATQAYNYFRLVANQGISAVVISIAEWTLNGTEESLCVTNDAKVGVGIANPQRALEVAGDLVVSGTISGGAGMGSFRNRVINGDMRIAQRGASANIAPASGGGGSYGSVDRWFTWARLGSLFSVQQSSTVPLGLGFTYSWLITSLSGYTVVSNDYHGVGQYIEGYNISDLNWGTSYGSPVTVSFWVRSSIAGNYCLSLEGTTSFQPSYVAPYTINNPNTWQQIVLAIPPPPNGYTANFSTTNGAGVRLWWDLGSGDGTYATTPGAWVVADKLRFAGSTNLLGTNGATMYLTGVQLEKGTVATPFEVRPYATELQLCQRYFTKLGGTIAYEGIGSGVCTSATNASILCPTPVPMRDISVLANYTINVVNVGNLQLQSNVSGSWQGTGATAITRDRPGTNGILLAVTVSGGLSLGQAATLTNTNTTGGVIQINNEL